MDILTSFLLLILSFICLFFGRYSLRKSTIYIATYYNIKKFYIEITFFSFISFCPTIFISIFSLVLINNEFSFKLILGTNITSILVIIGFSAIFFPFTIRRSFIKFEISILILISVLIIFFIKIKLKYFDIIIYSIILILFIILNFLKKKRKEVFKNTQSILIITPQLNFIFFILSLCLIIFSCYLITYITKNIINFKIINESIMALIILPFLIILPDFLLFIKFLKHKKNNTNFIEHLFQSNIYNTLIIVIILLIQNKLNFNNINYNSYLIYTIFILINYIIISIFLIPKLKLSRFKGFLLFLVYIIFFIFTLINFK